MAGQGSPQLRSPLIPGGGEERATQNGQLSPRDAHGQGRVWYEDFSQPLGADGKVTAGKTFQSLIDKANDWLRTHKNVSLKSCETQMRLAIHTQDLRHRDLSVQRRSIKSGVPTHCMRVLRLWLTDKESAGGAGTGQLSCHDFIPEGEDTIPKLIHRVNKRLEDGTIHGRIVTIETVSISEVHGKFAPDRLLYTELPEKDQHMAFVLRVFCLDTGHPHPKETVDIKDVVPQQTDDGYEEFGRLVDRANIWMRNQSDIRIINLQSVLVKKDTGPHSETGTSCFYTFPGTESDTETDWFRILRVPYAHVTSKSESVEQDSLVSPFNYEMFTPEVIMDAEGASPRVQRTSELLPEIGTFLQNTGANMLCAETVWNPMDFSAEQSDAVFKWLQTIRIFYSGGVQVEEMAPLGTADTLSLTDHQGRKKHPGPIFLGNVTGGRMRYRMLIVGIIAFVCISLIVGLSVYYANYG